MGVDAIPEDIRSSEILTGNDLGMLGNVTQFPSQENVDNFAKDNPQFMGLEMTKKHTFAKAFLNTNHFLLKFHYF